VLLEADTIVQMRIRDMLACAFFLVSRMCEHDTSSEYWGCLLDLAAACSVFV